MGDAQISFPLDSDGFLSQECPECERIFKVVFDQSDGDAKAGGKPLAFCPYCGHQELDAWWTKDQVSYLAEFATETFVRPIIRDFGENLKRSLAGSSMSVKTTMASSKSLAAPIESEVGMSVALFKCCDENIKHDGSRGALHCICCGELKSVEGEAEAGQ